MSPPTPRCHPLCPPTTDPAGVWRLGSPQLRVDDAPSHRTPYHPMSPLTPLCHPLPPGVIPYVPLPQIRPVFGDSGAHNFGLTTRRLTEPITDGFEVDAAASKISFRSFSSIQQGRQSLYWQLPPKFRGDQVQSDPTGDKSTSLHNLRFILTLNCQPKS